MDDRYPDDKGLFSNTHAACPSDAMLDRYHWGELAAEEKDALSQHLQECSLCQQRIALREKGFDAFGAARPDAMLNVIESRLGRGVFSSIYSNLFGTGMRVAATAMAAALAIVVTVFAVKYANPEQGHISDQGLRAMGGLEFRVFVKRSDVVTEAMSGDEFHPGDRLRFRVSLPFDGYVLLFGQENSGKIYPVFPVSGGLGEKMSAASSVPLPGAIRLDSSLGKESLFVLLCKKELSFDMIEVSADMEIRVPDACRLSSFALNKTGR